MKRAGFTMIELAVVILIMAIAAAAVTLRVQRPLQNAKTQDILSAIDNFDKVIRAAARSQDRPLKIVMNLSSGKFAQADDSGTLIPGPSLTLPDGYSLARLLVRRQDCSEGEASVSCSRRGLTPTYAMLLQTPGQSQWLVVAGLSGEILQVNSEDEAKGIVATTSGGHDAR